MNQDRRARAAAVRAKYPSQPPQGDDPEARLAYERGQNLLWRAAADEMVEAFITTNHQGKITEVNPAAVELFRQRADILLGQDVMGLLRDAKTKEDPSAIRKAILEGKSLKGFRVAIERPDGEFTFARLKIKPHIEDGILIRVFGFFEDMTEIEALQAALRREMANRSHDPATAFLAPKAFLERLEYQLAVARRIGYPLALIHLLVGVARKFDAAPPLQATRAVADGLRTLRQGTELIAWAPPNGFYVLLANVAFGQLREWVDAVKSAANVAWQDENRISQLPLPLICSGVLSESATDAVTFIQQVEETTSALRRDSGTFPAPKRPS